MNVPDALIIPSPKRIRTHSKNISNYRKNLDYLNMHRIPQLEVYNNNVKCGIINIFNLRRSVTCRWQIRGGSRRESGAPPGSRR